MNDFDLETQIAQWRQRMVAGRLKKPEVLNELEMHLREQFASLVRSGLSEEEAFRTASSRLGGAESLAHEFAKLKVGLGKTGKFALVAWELAALLLAWFIAVKIFPEGKNMTLAAHIFTLTAGYLAAFVAGGFAACQILNRSFRVPICLRAISFTEAIILFNRIAVVFVGVGIVLGMIWTKISEGHLLFRNMKELGAIGAWLWLAAVAFLQWRGSLDEHDLSLAGIAGSLAVNLAWFAAGFMDSYLHGYSPAEHWWFWGIVLNLFCLLLGIVSRNGFGGRDLKEG